MLEMANTSRLRLKPVGGSKASGDNDRPLAEEKRFGEMTASESFRHRNHPTIRFALRLHCETWGRRE
jgi:hypothetical protein